jgi:hypothetical protein
VKIRRSQTTADLKFVPLTYKVFEYQPLLPLSGEAMKSFVSSNFYHYTFVLACVTLAVIFAIPALRPTSEWSFVLITLATYGFAIVEFGRMDRQLTKRLLMCFDFWFLAAYTIVFVTIQLWASISFPTNDGHPVADLRGFMLYQVVSNQLFFWANLASFCLDAMPHAQRSHKLALGTATFFRNIKIGDAFDARKLLLGYLISFSVCCLFAFMLVLKTYHRLIWSVMILFQSENYFSMTSF